jgi:zinc-ribbon domain
MKKICDKCGADNLDNARYCSNCGHTLAATTVATPPPPGQMPYPVYPKPPRDNKKIVWIILAVAGFLLISFGVRFAVKRLLSNSRVVDMALTRIADQANQNCPRMLNNSIRIDNVTALPGKTLQYSFTFLNIQKGQLNFDSLSTQMAPTIIGKIKSSPEMQQLRIWHITFIYNYKDEDGNDLGQLKVTPEQYE